MKSPASQASGKTLIVMAVIFGLSAYDNSATAPSDNTSRSPQSDLELRVALDVSTTQAEAGQIVWIELGIPDRELGSGGSFEVVLSWDDSSFEYLYTRADRDDTALIGLADGESTRQDLVSPGNSFRNGPIDHGLGNRAHRLR